MEEEAMWLDLNFVEPVRGRLVHAITTLKAVLRTETMS